MSDSIYEGYKSNYERVGDFHEKFGLENGTHRGYFPRPWPPEALIQFRLGFLHEELKELERAYEAQDITGVFDALIDLVYVALGTAQVHGLPWEAGFAEVQRANMTKERAVRAEQSARGSTFDVVKPMGWQPPDLVRVLRDYGWDVPDQPLFKNVPPLQNTPLNTEAMCADPACPAYHIPASRWCAAHRVEHPGE